MTGIGAAAVGEFDFDAFFLEIAEGIGEVHGGIEDGMGHLVEADGRRSVVVAAAGGKGKEGKERRSRVARNFFIVRSEK